LPEARIDVKKDLYIKVIFVTTTDEGCVWILDFEDVVVEANVLDKSRFLLTVWWDVKRADNETLYVTISRSPQPFGLWDLKIKISCKDLFLVDL
jgi:hypothetical protein